MQEINQQEDLAFRALFERYKSSQMAHFYTLHTAGVSEVEQKSQVLDNWIKEFLAKILSFENDWTAQHARETLERGHEDILFVETEQKSYKVNDDKIEEFFNFIRFKPSKLNYCITVFKESQKISQILANKLLKTLEEPPHRHIFIFLKSSNEKSLATIDSRTIKIHITHQAKLDDGTIQQDLDFSSFIKKNCKDEQLQSTLLEVSRKSLRLDELKDLIKERPQREINLHQLIASFINQSNQFDMTQQAQCLNVIKSSTEEIPFNGAVKSRLTRLLHFVID